MKNIIVVSIIGVFLFLGSSQTFAQSTSQEKREEAKEKQIKAQEKRGEAQEKQNKAQSKMKKAEGKMDRTQNKMDSAQARTDRNSDDKSDKMLKGNSGNAYGKDKGDMTGREFGQYRAHIAQNKADKTNTKLSETDSILEDRRERLKRMKESLEERASLPAADKKEIEERRENISKAEEKLSQLEILLNETQERLRKTERSLKTLTPESKPID